MYVDRQLTSDSRTEVRPAGISPGLSGCTVA